MPTYTYQCNACKWIAERIVPIAERDKQTCSMCGDPLVKCVDRPAPAQFRGRVLQGGGPDRFTADVMGISDLRDLPAGLKTAGS